jgi:hypothetical protein
MKKSFLSKTCTAILVALSSIVTGTPASAHELCRGIIDPIYTYGINITPAVDTGITEAQFNQALDRIQAVYGKFIESTYNVKFKIDRLWTSGTVNAFANQQDGTWLISMHGGLARHPTMTPWGFLMVACHEVAHHLAGKPLYEHLSWAGAEGQSDYFAALSCVQRVFADGWESGWSMPPLHTAAEAACRQNKLDESTQALCLRNARMGYDTANFLATLMGSRGVDFTKPDPTQVKKTYDAHPPAQCRLDTYFQGALCSAETTISRIGLEVDAGVCWTAQGADLGTRPRCWFNPEAPESD